MAKKRQCINMTVQKSNNGDPSLDNFRPLLAPAAGTKASRNGHPVEEGSRPRGLTDSEDEDEFEEAEPVSASLVLKVISESVSRKPSAVARPGRAAPPAVANEPADSVDGNGEKFLQVDNFIWLGTIMLPS